MKKFLFFLFITNCAWAQTDSVAALYDTTKTIIKDEIVVSATRAGAHAPTTFQFISKQELEKNNLGQDLPILLDHTPNAVSTSDAGAGIGYTGIRIRGSDNTRVNATLNGIPINDAESQATFWVDLPDVVSSAQSIQIQRGIGSSTNGGSAFGGSVSLQTQSPSLKPFVEANISGGSFGTFKINGKAGTGMHKGFFFEGSASWITSEGYIQRAASNLLSYFTQIGYLRNNTLIKLVYFAGKEKTYQAWNGVPQDSLATNRTYNDLGTDYGQHLPAYKNQTDNYQQDYFQLLFAQQLPAYLNLNAGLFATLGHGYYEEYKAGETFNNYFAGHDTLDLSSDLVRQKWLKNIFYGGSFSLVYEHKNISFTAGGLAAQYRGQHFGKVIWAETITDFDKNNSYYSNQSVKNDVNFYAKLNYEWLQKVNFYLDIQYRYVSYNTNGVDDDQTPFAFTGSWHFANPKAGILYHIKPQHQLYASYALGHREPNRDDVLAALASGKKVKPETMHNVEAGYKFAHARYPFSVNYYLMQYSNQLVLTGKLNDVGNPIKENVPVSYRTGLELSADVNVYSKKQNRVVFAIRDNLSLSLNKIKEFKEYIYTYDDNYSPVDSLTQIISHRQSTISFSPSIVASLELSGYPVKGLEVSLITKAVSKQYLDNTTNEARKIKPYTYSNLRLTYQLPLKRSDKEIKFTLLLNNLFNRFFESNGYTYSERYYSGGQVSDTYSYNYYYPQAGFNFLVGIKVKI